MFRATTAVRQPVSHLPPALLAPCGAGVVASKMQPSLAAGPMNQDSQCAGRVQSPESRNQNTELLALALFTQYLGQAVRPTKASVSSSVKWVQLCLPRVAAAAVRKEAKFPHLQMVAPPPGTTQESHPHLPTRKSSHVLGSNPALTAGRYGMRCVFFFFFFCFLIIIYLCVFGCGGSLLLPIGILWLLYTGSTPFPCWEHKL